MSISSYSYLPRKVTEVSQGATKAKDHSALAEPSEFVCCSIHFATRIAVRLP